MRLGKRPKRLFLSEKAITRMHAIAIVIILVVAIATVYLIATQLTLGPGDGSDGDAPNGNSNGTGQPDLEISNVRVPSPPKVGASFNIQVKVTNIGDAKSGSYDLIVSVIDMSDPTETVGYYLGRFSQDPLQPNEERLWDHWVQPQNFLEREGDHMVSVLIEPIGFEDDDSNNYYETISFWVSKP